MPPWTFLRFVGTQGDVITAWLRLQEPEVIAAFLHTRLLLAPKPAGLEQKGLYKPLERKHAGLHEICFTIPWEGRKSTVRRFRIATFYRPTEREVVMFSACEKVRDRGMCPVNAFDVALILRDEYLAGGGTTHEL